MVAGILTGGTGMLTAASAQAAEPVSAQDTAWAQSNAQTDLAEITIGQIAMQRSQNSNTLALAQVTMSDHEKALAQLKNVAAQTGIVLPTTPSATQQSQAAELKTVPSGQFDATYDSFQIQGHEQSIAQTEAEVAHGTNPTVKQFAAVSYLPVAEKHLQMAEMNSAALSGATAEAPAVSAGTGGMAATRPADDAPWLALGAVGVLLMAGTGAAGLRRRVSVTR
jgi:putative membrane protein